MGVATLAAVIIWTYLQFSCHVFSQMLLQDSDDRFPPLLLTALQSLAGCVGACIFGGISFGKLARRAVERHTHSFPLRIAVAHFIGIACTNLSLRVLAVSAVHVVKAIEPILSTVATAYMMRESVNRQQIAGTFLTFLGIGVFVTDQEWSQQHVPGAVLIVCACAGVVVRSALLRAALGEKPRTSVIVETFALMSLHSFVLSTALHLLSALVGFGSIPTSLNGTVLVFACIFHLFYNSFSLLVLRGTGKLGWAAAIAAKRLAVIAAAGWLFGGIASQSSAAGVLVSSVGAGYLGIIRGRQSRAAADDDEQQILHPVPMPVAQHFLDQPLPRRRVGVYVLFVCTVIGMSLASMPHETAARNPAAADEGVDSIPTVAGRSLDVDDAEDLLSAAEQRLAAAREAKSSAKSELDEANRAIKALDPSVNLFALFQRDRNASRICRAFSNARVPPVDGPIARYEASYVSIERQINASRAKVAALRDAHALEVENKVHVQHQMAEVQSAVNAARDERREFDDFRSEAMSSKIVFFTGTANSNLGDDEMPAAWLAHIAAQSLNWIPYFAVQQAMIRINDSPEVIQRRVNRNIPPSLIQAGFTSSYFMFPALIFHRPTSEPVRSFRDFDGMIVGGGGIMASGGYVEFFGLVVLAETGSNKRPVFVAGSGAFFPHVTLFSALLQQAMIVSVRDNESMHAIELYAASSSQKQQMMQKTRKTADLIAAAPQRLFHLPSLNFPPLPQPVPRALRAAIKQLDRDDVIGTGPVAVTQDWRNRFPICWILKKGHEDFVKSTMKASFSPADFVITASSKELNIARQYATYRQIYVFTRNTTDFAIFLQKKCKMVVSMALHGTIYAIRLGIPVFGIMAGKIEGALDHFGGYRLVRACTTSSVVPSLAAIVRCHMKYNRNETLARIDVVQDDFANFLRDVDRKLLTEKDLGLRAARHAERVEGRLAQEHPVNGLGDG